MWKVVRENPRAVVYAVLMHLVLLVLLMISLDWTPTATKPGGTRPIEAKLVDHKQLKAIEDRKLAEQAAKQKAEAERKRKAEQARKKKAEAERKRQAEQVAKQKAEVERKRKAEQAVKKKADAERKRKAEQATKQKADAERKRKAEQATKQKAEAERKRKAEQAAKQKAEAAVRQREMEQAMQAEIAAEQQAEKEARDQGVVAEHVAYIQEKVRRNWLRPSGSSDDFTCTLEVSLIPGGDVAKARVVQSCGSTVLDRSVESAVFKAAPLPVPRDAGLFHHFRELRFVFSPG
jgi:colicin import membrane protein